MVTWLRLRTCLPIEFGWLILYISRSRGEQEVKVACMSDTILLSMMAIASPNTTDVVVQVTNFDRSWKQFVENRQCTQIDHAGWSFPIDNDCAKPLHTTTTN